jgi:DNA-binding NtrC family response regulator
MFVNKLKKQKILVVEDDLQARNFMKQFLDDEECIVELARDGEEAIEKFNHFKPQLVLLDIKLPKMNGIQVLKIIKSKNPDVPVIMTTGLSTIEATQECLRAGAYTHIIKPIDFDNLGTIIIQALHLEKEGAGFAPEPKEKQSASKHLGKKVEAETEHKIDAVIQVLLKTGVVTHSEIIEEIEKIKKEAE